MRIAPVLLLTTALLVGASACGSDGPTERQAATPLPDVTTSAPAATDAPSDDPTGDPGVTSGSTDAPSSSPSSSTSASPTATPSASTPAFPEAVTAPVQGGSYFAVYLAVVKSERSDTAATTKAEAEAKAAGYETGTGDIDCERGARTALKLDKSSYYTGTSIFFATAALAKQFVDAYQPGVVGTAKITAYCLD